MKEMADISEKGAEALAGMVADSALLNVSLRDFFAAFALAGMLANSGYHFDYGSDDEERSVQAYSFADSMLLERHRKAT